MKRKLKLVLITIAIVLISLLVYADSYESFIDYNNASTDFDMSSQLNGKMNYTRDNSAPLQNYGKTKSQDEINNTFNVNVSTNIGLTKEEYDKMNDTQRTGAGKNNSSAVQNQAKRYTNDYNKLANDPNTDEGLVHELTSHAQENETSDKNLSMASFDKIYNDIKNNQSVVESVSTPQDYNVNNKSNDFTETYGKMTVAQTVLDTTRDARNKMGNRFIWCVASSSKRVEDTDSDGNNIGFHYEVIGDDVLNRNPSVDYSGWQTKNVNGVQENYNETSNLYNIPQNMLTLCERHDRGRRLGVTYTWNDYNNKPFGIFNDEHDTNGNLFRVDNGKRVVYAPDVKQLLNMTLHALDDNGGDVHIFAGKVVHCRSHANVDPLYSDKHTVLDTDYVLGSYAKSSYGTHFSAIEGNGGSIDLCNESDGKDLGITDTVVKPYVCEFAGLDNMSERQRINYRMHHAVSKSRYMTANCGGNCGDEEKCSFKPDLNVDLGSYLGLGFGQGEKPTEDEFYIMSAKQLGNEGMRPIEDLGYDSKDEQTYDYWSYNPAGRCDKNGESSDWQHKFCEHLTGTYLEFENYCKWDTVLPRKIMDVLVKSSRQSQVGVTDVCGGITLKQLELIDWKDPQLNDGIKDYVDNLVNAMNISNVMNKSIEKGMAKINETVDCAESNPQGVADEFTLGGKPARCCPVSSVVIGTRDNTRTDIDTYAFEGKTFSNNDNFRYTYNIYKHTRKDCSTYEDESWNGNIARTCDTNYFHAGRIELTVNSDCSLHCEYYGNTNCQSILINGQRSNTWN